jgi:hypothetical protein
MNNKSKQLQEVIEIRDQATAAVKKDSKRLK